MSLSSIISENMRLIILQALEEDPDYSHNESVIQGVLSTFGHNPSRDRLRTELSWLEEQGLISISDVSDLLIVKLTPRGQDVALSRTSVPGVARRMPRS